MLFHLLKECCCCCGCLCIHSFIHSMLLFLLLLLLGSFWCAQRSPLYDDIRFFKPWFDKQRCKDKNYYERWTMIQRYNMERHHHRWSTVHESIFSVPCHSEKHHNNIMLMRWSMRLSKFSFSRNRFRHLWKCFPLFYGKHL